MGTGTSGKCGIHAIFPLQVPTSSTTSRTSSTSPSQEESQQELSTQPSPPVQALPPTTAVSVDSCPPTPPEPQPPSMSKRSIKMHENPETWAHGSVRDMQQRDYPRTPPTEWKSYAQHKKHYSSQLDRDCVSDLPRQRDEEDDDEEAYWSSMRTLYDKTPSSSRPRPVSGATALVPWVPLCTAPQAQPLPASLL